MPFPARVRNVEGVLTLRDNHRVRGYGASLRICPCGRVRALPSLSSGLQLPLPGRAGNCPFDSLVGGWVARQSASARGRAVSLTNQLDARSNTN